MEARALVEIRMPSGLGLRLGFGLGGSPLEVTLLKKLDFSLDVFNAASRAWIDSLDWYYTNCNGVFIVATLDLLHRDREREACGSDFVHHGCVFAGRKRLQGTGGGGLQCPPLLVNH